MSFRHAPREINIIRKKKKREINGDMNTLGKACFTGVLSVAKKGVDTRGPKNLNNFFSTLNLWWNSTSTDFD